MTREHVFHATSAPVSRFGKAAMNFRSYGDRRYSDSASKKRREIVCEVFVSCLAWGWGRGCGWCSRACGRFWPLAVTGWPVGVAGIQPPTAMSAPTRTQPSSAPTNLIGADADNTRPTPHPEPADHPLAPSTSTHPELRWIFGESGTPARTPSMCWNAASTPWKTPPSSGPTASGNLLTAAGNAEAPGVDAVEPAVGMCTYRLVRALIRGAGAAAGW